MVTKPDTGHRGLCSQYQRPWNLFSDWIDDLVYMQKRSTCFGTRGEAHVTRSQLPTTTYFPWDIQLPQEAHASNFGVRTQYGISILRLFPQTGVTDSAAPTRRIVVYRDGHCHCREKASASTLAPVSTVADGSVRQSPQSAAGRREMRWRVREYCGDCTEEISRRTVGHVRS